MQIVDIHAHPLLNRLYRLPAGAPAPDPCLGIDVLARGQVGVVVSSIYPFWGSTHRTAYMAQCHGILQVIAAHVATHNARATVAATCDDLARARAQNKIAFIHAVEGGHVLEGRSENLETLYAWGVRSLTLTHFLNNDLAASTFDPRRKLAGRDGLTPLGCEVVAGMNSLGMIVDLAHCSERAFWQALELTQQPVIVSHTGIRHFVPWEICLSDEQLRAIAQNGGLVGIILSALWLRRPQIAAGLSNLVGNILYACAVAGVEHVAIGSDFNGTPRIRGVATAAELPCIAEGLAAAGLPAEDIAKIMGGNFIRVFGQVVGA